MSEPGGLVDPVVDEMEGGLAAMAPTDARRHFHATYLRTTRAIADEARAGGFVDREWVERWDVAFARLYLDALDAWNGGRSAAAWRIPFRAAREHPEIPAVLHVLFGMNVHINIDLPQSLLAVITSEEFDDPEVLALRERDHRRIDAVLLRRIAAEEELLPDHRRLVDRLLAPLNRRATARFLRESREKVWRNAQVLDVAVTRTSPRPSPGSTPSAPGASTTWSAPAPCSCASPCAASGSSCRPLPTTSGDARTGSPITRAKDGGLRFSPCPDDTRMRIAS